LSTRFSLEIHSYCVRVVGGLGCVGKSKLFCIFWVGLCVGCLSKMVLKNVRWEKNKKHWVGLSVGSNVLLKYGLYVVCHLSKWFTFSCLFNGHFLLCRVVIRLQLTFRQLGVGGGFRSTKLSTCIELDTKHKAPFCTSPRLTQNPC
jgi:hypothetical protein